jgi:hypothetical protein
MLSVQSTFLWRLRGSAITGKWPKLTNKKIGGRL